MVQCNQVVFADKKRDRDSIRYLWQTCFGDENIFIDFYFSERMTDQNMLVIHKEGKVVSMASFWEAEYVTNSNIIPIRYIYAVGTVPEYRREGLAGTILESAKDIWPGSFVLSPAEEKLYHYYKKQGFFPAWTEKQILPGNTMDRLVDSVCDSDCNFDCDFDYNIDCDFEKITPEEYKVLRDAHFELPGYLKWDVAAIRFAMNTFSLFGGKTVAIIPKNYKAIPIFEKAVIIYYVKENRGKKQLVIVETTLEEKILNAFLPRLMLETGTDNAIYTLPGGMICSTNENMSPEEFNRNKNAYLNLVLA